MSNADVAKRNVRRREFEVLRRQNSGLGDVLQRASVDELCTRAGHRGSRVGVQGSKSEAVAMCHNSSHRRQT
jgi:hypothetical protein